MELVALRPICYGNREYRRGDMLPEVPEDVAGIWLESGSAIPSEDWQILWRDRDRQGILHYFGPTQLKVSLVRPLQIRYRVK